MLHELNSEGIDKAWTLRPVAKTPTAACVSIDSHFLPNESCGFDHESIPMAGAALVKRTNSGEMK